MDTAVIPSITGDWFFCELFELLTPDDQIKLLVERAGVGRIQADTSSPAERGVLFYNWLAVLDGSERSSLYCTMVDLVRPEPRAPYLEVVADPDRGRPLGRTVRRVPRRRLLTRSKVSSMRTKLKRCGMRGKRLKRALRDQIASFYAKEEGVRCPVIDDHRSRIAEGLDLYIEEQMRARLVELENARRHEERLRLKEQEVVDATGEMLELMGAVLVPEDLSVSERAAFGPEMPLPRDYTRHDLAARARLTA